MKRLYLIGLFLLCCATILAIVASTRTSAKSEVKSAYAPPQQYWFMLHRTSNKEFLYKGVPGEVASSSLVKEFSVKVGIPGERPMPLPQLAGRKYWNIVAKEPSDNPETGPYFLTLDIPTSDEWPYGPTPYLECNGQCDWVTVGYFGLHGVGADPTKLSPTDAGSSGCVRHSDEDITFLYNLLEVGGEGIRYYIQDI